MFFILIISLLTSSSVSGLWLVCFGIFVSSGWYFGVPVKDCHILVILLEKNSAKPLAISSLALPGGSGLLVLHPVRLFTILNNSLVFLLLSIICLVIICFLCGISVVCCTCFFQQCRSSSGDALCFLWILSLFLTIFFCL